MALETVCHAHKLLLLIALSVGVHTVEARRLTMKVIEQHNVSSASEKLQEGSLDRYDTSCYGAGTDMASRDASCKKGLYCARAGYDGRVYGDCGDHHCCTKPRVIDATLAHCRCDYQCEGFHRLSGQQDSYTTQREIFKSYCEPEEIKDILPVNLCQFGLHSVWNCRTCWKRSLARYGKPCFGPNCWELTCPWLWNYVPTVGISAVSSYIQLNSVNTERIEVCLFLFAKLPTSFDLVLHITGKWIWRCLSIFHQQLCCRIVRVVVLIRISSLSQNRSPTFCWCEPFELFVIGIFWVGPSFPNKLCMRVNLGYSRMPPVYDEYRPLSSWEFSFAHSL